MFKRRGVDKASFDPADIDLIMARLMQMDAKLDEVLALLGEDDDGRDEVDF